jgi:leucyl aminopeptidase (aminopeptidase T)
MSKETLNHSLHEVPFDAEYSPGARNAVRTCLRILPTEKVTIITDRDSQEIAASIAYEVEAVGAPYNAWVLEDFAERPLKAMPPEILDDLESSNVSVYAVHAQEGELPTRMQMTDVVNRRRIRHAHMVNINRRIMLESMRADFNRVDEISKRVLEIVSAERLIRARTAAGTELAAEMNPDYRWLKTSGIISEEKWGNLPGGEIFTTPHNVTGTYVVDGVLGDYFSARYGDLAETPLRILIEDNRIEEISCSNTRIEDDFWAYTHTDDNSDRVGEFAIGTNIEVRDIIGHILQDEKYPGLHIAFGDPYGEFTGADWYSSTHIDVVGRKFDIWAGERQIMRAGEFLL